jgi:DNA-binding response OmpR family regulator
MVGMNTIFVIDDSRVFLKYITTTLESNNFSVIACKTSSTAIKEIEKVNPDCILTDLEMPELRGDKLCKLLKESETLNHIPVLMLTSKTGDDALVQAITAGADDYLLKTANEKVIMIKIKSMLRLKQLQADNVRLKQFEAVKSVIARYNHEINNILTILMGHQRKLSDLCADENIQVYDVLSKIGENYSRMSKLIKSLNRLSSFSEDKYSDDVKILRLDDE